MNRQSLASQRFCLLTVVEDSGLRTGGRAIRWRCKCDCGGETLATRRQLVSGNVSNCGCVPKQYAYEPDLDLGIVLKDKRDGRFAVPLKGPLGLVNIGAGGVPLRRGDLGGGIAAMGHGVPGDVGEVALPGAAVLDADAVHFSVFGF